MDRDKLQYIVDATNDVHHILAETIKPSEDDFRRIFAVCCNTLTRVVAQTEILQDLGELATRQAKYWTEYQAITGSVNHFVNGFCNIDRQVMIEAGINDASVRTFTQEAINLREHLKNLRIQPEEVRQSLRTLHHEACEVARYLHNLPHKRLEQRSEKKKLMKFFYGIGGVAIVAANGSTFALTLGMSLAGTAVSGSLGCALVGAAFAIEV